MWEMSEYFKKVYEKRGVTLEEAWKKGFFEELSELRFKDFNGFQTFYSEDPEEIFNFMKESGVTKFIPWTSIFIKDDWVMFHGFNFKFKTRKKRRGNIPQSQRDKIDRIHANIKGQCTKRY